MMRATGVQDAGHGQIEIALVTGSPVSAADATVTP